MTDVDSPSEAPSGSIVAEPGRGRAHGVPSFLHGSALWVGAGRGGGSLQPLCTVRTIPWNVPAGRGGGESFSFRPIKVFNFYN